MILWAFDANFGQRFRTFRCSSTDEALALLEQRGGEIGVVISEVRMPGMSGVALLARALTQRLATLRQVATGIVHELMGPVGYLKLGPHPSYAPKYSEREKAFTAGEGFVVLAGISFKPRSVQCKGSRHVPGCCGRCSGASG